jgi:hypothetical protein
MQIATPTPTSIPLTMSAAVEFLAQHRDQELALIQGAPVLFLATVLILAGIMYFANRAYFQSTISGLRAHVGALEARIEFQVDKLKDAEQQAGALANEVPPELKAQVRSLEENLQRIATRRVDQQTIEGLTKLMTEAGELFELGKHLVSPEDIDVWNNTFDAWYTSAHAMITTRISQSEAVLFAESPGGALIGHHRNRGHNQNMNTLLGYQSNLRRIIERYGDR